MFIFLGIPRDVRKSPSGVTEDKSQIEEVPSLPGYPNHPRNLMPSQFYWIHVCINVWKSLSHVRLCGTPRIVACQAPLCMEFSRQEYQRGYLFPFSGDLPDPGITPGSPALQVGLPPSEPPGKPTESVGEGIVEDWLWELPAFLHSVGRLVWDANLSSIKLLYALHKQMICWRSPRN